MCGRFNIITDPKAWMDVLEVVRSSDGPGRFEPRYNIGPSEPPRPAGSRRASPRRITRVPIVYRQEGEFVGEDAVWPLIPVWARGEVPRYSTANARDPQRRPQPPPHAVDTETDATRASNQHGIPTFGPLHD